MTRYRQQLPQLDEHLFMTDGGLETTLVFHEGMDLPHFAAFDLLASASGRNTLRTYYQRYARMAVEHGMGMILESPTWRANSDWGDRLGYDRATLAEVNLEAIALMSEIRANFSSRHSPMVISGNLGPRGDGYTPSARMSVTEAEDYHAEQIEVFAGSAADMVAAFTINYVDEAIGIATAARSLRMPLAISFTVETDGRLPDGASLASAIQRTDASSDSTPAYYMLNCAHPDHFRHLFRDDEPWQRRIRGVRANASRLSHAELDTATELDIGNPRELGNQYRELTARLPWLRVFGGCCGTDHRHVDEICSALQAA
ncbi:MAG: homocysteine S-methyltransferase family protein [Gammaproteobacteria bacterium]|nr:homocysteine S-methyltransferase family protein [Gammaproteobacteria bacterium]